MIKVSELLKRGIKLNNLDTLYNPKSAGVRSCESVGLATLDDYYVTEFARRFIDKGERPDRGNTYVVCQLEDGEMVTKIASDVNWGGGDITSWMPSMPHLIHDEREGRESKESVKYNHFEFATEIIKENNSTDAAVATVVGMGYTFHGGTQWKPPLKVKSFFVEGVEWKPVFTQAMHDAGESPPVGSWVLAGSHKSEVVLGKDAHGIIIVEAKGFWLSVRASECEPLSTERDLITNDLQDIIASQGFLNKDNITDQIANLIYDAGYRKSDK